MTERRLIEVYEPCGCGWRYDDATLAAYAMGHGSLDLNPTHACRVRSEQGDGRLVYVDEPSAGRLLAGEDKP